MDGGKQAPGFYRYKVGSLDVTVVTDGANVTPLPENYVINAHKDEVAAALGAAYLEQDKLTIPYSPIVVTTGSKLVLIDTGTGEANLPRSKGTAGQLQLNLAAAGIDRGQITTVIISHFHRDHVNGLLTADNKPAFPEAEILVPQVEWAFWMNDADMGRASHGRMQDLFANNRRVFDALGRKVTPYEWDNEVVAGITAIGTPGHTVGHTSFLIASRGEQVYVQSDVTNVPYLFARNPGWHGAFDQDPEMAEQTRRKVYDMLSAEKLLVQGFHFPFPGLGHVEKDGNAYRVIPAPWTPFV